MKIRGIHFLIFLLLLFPGLFWNCDSTEENDIKNKQITQNNYPSEAKNSDSTVIRKIEQTPVDYSDQKNQNKKIPKYSVLDEEIYDAPIKTQVVKHLLLLESTDKRGIKNLLESQYNNTTVRTGFEYHANPTNIFIYVYDSEDKASAKSGQWIAMLEKTPDKKTYQITLLKDNFEIKKGVVINRFGMSEAKRRMVFKEYIQALDRATINAINKEPYDVDRQIKIEDQLAEKYKNQLAKKYNLTRDQLEQIIDEGIEKSWSRY